MKQMVARPRASLVVIEERVILARSALQDISDQHPAFETRVKALLRLIAQRDRVVAAGKA